MSSHTPPAPPEVTSRAPPPFDLQSRPVDPNYLPYAIVKHKDLIPTLIQNFRTFCEEDGRLGNDPDLLSHLQYKRKQMPGLELINTAASALFTFSELVGQPVTYIMDYIDQDVDYEQEVRAPVVGVLSGHVWKVESIIDSAVLVVHPIGYLDAAAFFPRMDLKADESYVFNDNSTYIIDEDSIMVQVGSKATS
jgi:hypothetical protein